MERSSAFHKFGLYSFPAQFILLLAALSIGAALEFGRVFSWLFFGSQVVGLVSLFCGIALSFLQRRRRWLLLSVASGCLIAFSALFGIAIGAIPYA